MASQQHPKYREHIYTFRAPGCQILCFSHSLLSLLFWCKRTYEDKCDLHEMHCNTSKDHVTIPRSLYKGCCLIVILPPPPLTPESDTPTSNSLTRQVFLIAMTHSYLSYWMTCTAATKVHTPVLSVLIVKRVWINCSRGGGGSSDLKTDPPLFRKGDHRVRILK